jgi:hypothetical protein
MKERKNELISFVPLKAPRETVPTVCYGTKFCNTEMNYLRR